MRVSLITGVLNAKDTIGDTIESIVHQSYPAIEYIVIDGGSKDGTIEIVNRYKNKIAAFISEPDNGHFEAMNKGLKMATGEIVGFLHADDFLVDGQVIAKVVAAFKATGADCVWGDLVYVDRRDPRKVVRYWRAGEYKKGLFTQGWMPPHPAFFVRRAVYEKYGDFNTRLRISSDYEIMLRFLHKHQISSFYLPEVLVRMRVGGISNRSLKNLMRKSMEDYRAWKLNGLKGGMHIIFLKNISKIPQFFTGKDKV